MQQMEAQSNVSATVVSSVSVSLFLPQVVVRASEKHSVGTSDRGDAKLDVCVLQKRRSDVWPYVVWHRKHNQVA